METRCSKNDFGFPWRSRHTYWNIYLTLNIQSERFNENRHHLKEFANQSAGIYGNNQLSGLRKFRKWITMTKIYVKIDMYSNII